MRSSIVLLGYETRGVPAFDKTLSKGFKSVDRTQVPQMIGKENETKGLLLPYYIPTCVGRCWFHAFSCPHFADSF